MSIETKQLRAQLKKYAMVSKAENTFKKYRTPWKRWIKWSVTRSRRGEPTPTLPATPFDVALFLVHLANDPNKYKTVVETAVTAINFAHRINNFPEPYGHLAKAVNEAIKRERGCPVKKAKPLTTEILRSIAEVWALPAAPLWQNMMITMMSVGFGAFLRLDELSSVRRSDVVFYKDHMRIFVRKSKTDQYRIGYWVIVARSTNFFNPVTLMENYIQRLQPGPEEYLFRTIWRRTLQTTGVESLGTRKLSSQDYHTYSRKALIEVVGMSPQEAELYKGHSLRRGGATAAALARVPAPLRRIQGNWASQKSADGYVGPRPRDAMRVTRAMGL